MSKGLMVEEIGTDHMLRPGLARERLILGVLWIGSSDGSRGAARSRDRHEH